MRSCGSSTGRQLDHKRGSMNGRGANSSGRTPPDRTRNSGAFQPAISCHTSMSTATLRCKLL
jgi:hypothetical protein